MDRHRFLLRKTLIGLVAAAGANAYGQATATLSNSVLPVLSRSSVTGSLAANKIIFCTISLKPRFPVELQAFADSVSNPRSDMYRQWLTPGQVGLQFGAAPATVSAVVNYLKSKGMSITLQAPNNMAIMAKGTVTQVQNAFKTTLKQYSGPDLFGKTVSFVANSTALSVPSTWVKNVQAITGVQTWTRPYPAGQTQTLTPPLTRGLYNTKPAYLLGFRGEGRTVAISNWDGFSVSNVPLFVNGFNLPAPLAGVGTNVHVITIGTGSQGNAAQGEGDLDIQMELGLAPLATIMMYDDGPPDPVATLTKEGSDNLADVISESWGWNVDSSTAVAEHNQHLAMTAQGQTYMCCSGDTGTNWPQQLPYPDSDPEVLSVGGTIATVDDSTGARINEVTWDGSGGGWANSSFPFDKRPSWQNGPGIPASPNARLIPDIGMQAGGPGAFTIYFNGVQTSFDGTSCSSPTNAAGLAIVEQRMDAIGQPARFGRIQDVIYLQAGRSDVWHDITSGSIQGVLPNGQTATASAGWDMCTGWGAPDYDGLFNSLQQQVTITSIAPDAISTVIGDYIIGDPTSVSDSDSIYYQIGSNGIPQFGQAAGVSVSFTVPNTTAFMTISLAANSGIAGATNMVWLYNWNTGSYDFINATPVNVSGSAKKSIKVRTSDVSSYVGPGGEVDMLLRGHIPIKPFQNTVPNPFTYRIDQLELLVR